MWCAPGASLVVAAGLVVFVLGIALRPRKLFVGLVRTNVDQCSNVPDMRELGRFTAVVQRGDGQLNPAAYDLCDKGLLVEVAEVLLAQLGEGDQHVAEVAVQQLNGSRFRCWHEPQRILVGITHGRTCSF